MMRMRDYVGSIHKQRKQNPRFKQNSKVTSIIEEENRKAEEASILQALSLPSSQL
jgi:hypothetical protein